MNFRIVTRSSFSITGKSTLIAKADKHAQLPAFWSLCRNDGTMEALHAAGSDTVIGVGENNSHRDSFRYMIGTLAKADASHSFDKWVLPASTWVVFDPVLSTPECVGSVWEYIFTDFLPNGDYALAPTPDLEVNQKTSHPDADYTCEIWIPVVKKV